MNQVQFDFGMTQFDQRWERVSSKGKREVYFKSLNNIQSKGWEEIVDQAVDTFKMYPTPGELKTLYSQWLRDNPHMMNLDVVESDCEYCEGHGSFTYLKYEDQGYYEFISKCPHCSNLGKTKGMPELDKHQLQRLGYTVIPWVRESTAGKRPMIKDLPKLAEVATSQEATELFKGESL